MMGSVEIALLLVGMAVAVLAGTAAAERLSIPPPLLLIAAGIAGSYLPVMPSFRLEPEVVLPRTRSRPATSTPAPAGP